MSQINKILKENMISSNNRALFKKIPVTSLYVSEPNPRMFGNSDNLKSEYWTNSNWLKSKFHFAFAEWRSKISRFGVLRVLNDDLVQPDRGFGEHGHANMEIATFVLNGSLTHKDSMGNEESLQRGSVQFMSAGYGVEHSEFNKSKTDPLRFLQLWILPKRSNLKPNYGSYSGDSVEAIEARTNKWSHLVTSSENKKSLHVPIKLDQDVNIYIAEITGEGTKLDFKIEANRQAYIVNAEGETELLSSDKKESLSEGDAIEAFGPLDLSFESKSKGFWVIVEMTWDGSSRFSS